VITDALKRSAFIEEATLSRRIRSSFRENPDNPLPQASRR
jgi:hypothetical protein